MIIIHNFSLRLFTRPASKRRPSLAYLAYWAIILSISLAAILTLANPAYAASNAPVTHTNMQAHTSPQALLADCSNQGAGNYNAGQCTPFGIDTFLSLTDASLTTGNPAILTLWFYGLDVVDAFLIFLLIANGIRLMMSGSIFRYADVAETVPRVLLALIMSHLSYAAVKIFVAMNTGLTQGLLNYANNQSMATKTALSDMFGFGEFNLIQKLIEGVVRMVIALIPFIGQYIAGALTISAFVLLLIQVAFFLIKLVLAIMLIGQLVMRLALFNLYIIFSAPCIACSALPGRSGQPITRMWLQGFLSLCFVQIVQIGGLIVSEITMGMLGDKMVSALGGAFSFISAAGGGDVKPVALSFLGVLILWLVLRIPGLLGAAPMQTMSAGGNLLSSMISGGVGVVGSGVGLAAGAALLAR